MTLRANFAREKMVELEADITGMMEIVSRLIDLLHKIETFVGYSNRNEFEQLVNERIGIFMESCIKINKSLYTDTEESIFGTSYKNATVIMKASDLPPRGRRKR